MKSHASSATNLDTLPNNVTQQKKILLQNSPSANLTTVNTNQSQPWLVDSAASHHVTSNLNSLSLHQPYEGPDDIIHGDGSGLQISHTGNSVLSTPSKSFSLSHVLYVPNMQKNLISVSQFCKSNNASIEIFPLFLLSRISPREHVSFREGT